MQYEHKNTHTHPHTRTCTRARTHTHTHTHTYTCTHTHIQSHTQIHAYTHPLALSHTLTRSYTNIHIHTHTHRYNGLGKPYVSSLKKYKKTVDQDQVLDLSDSFKKLKKISVEWVMSHIWKIMVEINMRDMTHSYLFFTLLINLDQDWDLSDSFQKPKKKIAKHEYAHKHICIWTFERCLKQDVIHDSFMCVTWLT